MSVYRISDYSGSDGERIAAALEDAKKTPGSTVLIPPGSYTLTSELAREAQSKVMRGVWGKNPQRTMFNPRYEYSRGICFSGHDGTILSARGVTLMIDGFMEPVSVRDCRNVTVEGLTIDHLRKPYSKGIVVSAEKNAMTVEFRDEIFENTPLELRCCLYDIAKNRFFPVGARVSGYIDPRHVVFACENAENAVGLEFYTVHTFHSRPAVLIENAENTVLRDVTIHSQPGMGVVGNRSENILLSSLRVIPSAGEHFSTNTDATHFTSIKGLLRFENCDFDGQGDDSANIHGYYHTIFPTGPRSCWLKEESPDGTHAQTLDYPDAGDTLELTRMSDLAVLGSYKALSRRLDPENWRCEVELDRELPTEGEKGEGFLGKAYTFGGQVCNFADVTRLPRVEFVNCHSRNHFARGLLLKSRGALIENNTFTDIAGCGIEVAAESWWKEGVCPSDVIIRRNRIQFCGGGICVMADSDAPTSINIRNITIEDNIIECPASEHGIVVRNCENVRIARNKILCRGDPIHVSRSENVEIE